MNEKLMNAGQTTIPFHILIVEDDLTLLRLIKHKISSDEYIINTATNGSEAIEKVKSLRPSLLLLDYLLADMDCVQIIETLKKDGINTPFIIMTGFGDERVAVNMMKLGAIDYVVKDPNFMNLLPVVVEQVKESLTTRKKLLEAEKALEESEYNYKKLVESSRDIIFISDNDGRFLFINSTFEQITGYKVEDFIGRSFSDILDEDFIEIAHEKFINNATGNEIPLFEINIIADNKKTIPFELNIAELSDSNNKKRGLLAIARDITARKKAEDALRQNEEYFRTLIETSSDGIIILNGDGTFRFLSSSCERILGYSNNELIGRKLFDFVDQNDMVKAINFFWEVVQNTSDDNSFELSVVRKDGSKRYIEGIGQNLIRNPVVNGIFVTIRDLADRKRLEDQLVSAQKMEAVGRLAGGIAHDFNNIMTAIINYSEIILNQKIDNQKITNWVNSIIDSAKKAAYLTTQLLAFSSRQMFMPKVMTINDVLQDIITKIQSISKPNIELKFKPGKETMAIKSDKTQIEQILSNLVNNAQEAVKSRYLAAHDPEEAVKKGEMIGKIIIKTNYAIIDDKELKLHQDAYAGRFVCTSVTDDGIGLSTEDLRHIFEPFYTTKNSSKGAGLGLAVVFGIVKQHKGWIEVESEIGKGSEFNVYLPAVATEEKLQIEETKSIKDFRGKGERILLVEDEDNVRQITAETLRNHGYVVFEALNYENAMEIFNKENGDFSVIFSDVVLPDKTGIELIENLETEENTGIILTSGYFDEESQMSSMLDRNFRFLPKPYELDSLLKTIRDVIAMTR